MNYILFENEKINLDFKFTENELTDFIDLWRAGISASNIAKQMKRKPHEKGLLIVDRAEIGLNQMRAAGLAGL